MKIFKLLMTGLILVIVGLFIYQNLATFNSTQALKIDLYFESSAGTPPLYMLLVVSGALGFFVGIFLMLKPYLKVRRALAQTRQEMKLAGVEKEASGVSAEAVKTEDSGMEKAEKGAEELASEPAKS